MKQVSLSDTHIVETPTEEEEENKITEVGFDPTIINETARHA